MMKKRNVRNRQHWAYLRRLLPNYIVPESTLREVYDRKVRKHNKKVWAE